MIPSANPGVPLFWQALNLTLLSSILFPHLLAVYKERYIVKAKESLAVTVSNTENISSCTAACTPAAV